MTFQTIVKTVAKRNCLHADFSAKPLPHLPGNGFHINLSVKATDGIDYLPAVMAGVLEKIAAMTAFLNPTEESYSRFGSDKAPKYISWSSENRSQLIRVPAAHGEYRRAELRSPDPQANPYLAFALIISAGLDGIKRNLELPAPLNLNLFKAPTEALHNVQRLPETFADACRLAQESEFIAEVLPKEILDVYCNR